jgi:hypothetical protein
MRWISCLIVSLIAAPAMAQVVYEPVRHQYGGQNPYYYGGADPRIHESALWPSARGANWGRHNGFAFSSANIHTHREVVTERTRTFTDALGVRNAYVHGFTPNDASNEARNSIPLYFRKADMLRHAQSAADGWVVPAQWQRFGAPGTIEIKRWKRGGASERPVIVIPKDMLDQKLWEEPRKQLTSAS